MFCTLFAIDNATFIYFSPINENILFTDIRYQLIVKARKVLRGFPADCRDNKSPAGSIVVQTIPAQITGADESDDSLTH